MLFDYSEYLIYFDIMVAKSEDDFYKIDSYYFAKMVKVLLKMFLIRILEIIHSMTLFLFFNWIVLSIMYYLKTEDD